MFSIVSIYPFYNPLDLLMDACAEVTTLDVPIKPYAGYVKAKATRERVYEYMLACKCGYISVL